MLLYTILLILMSITWVVFETWLVIRDRSRGKGSTTVDKGTRNLNFIAIIVGISTAALVNGFSMFFFPGGRTPAVFYTGMAIMLGGMALRYWAVMTLGAFFRTTIETDSSQKVIGTGPYRLIRHPSYCGWLLICLGYGIALQNWLSLLAALLLPLAALLYRISIEEKVLAASLGSEYAAYQTQTRKLIPWIW